MASFSIISVPCRRVITITSIKLQGLSVGIESMEVLVPGTMVVSYHFVFFVCKTVICVSHFIDVIMGYGTTVVRNHSIKSFLKGTS